MIMYLLPICMLILLPLASSTEDGLVIKQDTKPSFVVEKTLITLFRINVTKILAETEKFSELSYTASQTIHDTVREVRNTYEFIYQDSSRKRRGLVNIVGKISKALFGTAQESDLTSFNASISDLLDNQHKLRLKLNSETTAISILHKEENELHDYVDTVMSQFKTPYVFYGQTMQVVEAGMRMTNYIQSLQTILEYSLQEECPTHLFQKNLQLSIYKSAHNSYRPLSSPKTHFQDLSDCRFLPTKDILIISVRSPLYNPAIKYHRFEACPFPVPLHNSTLFYEYNFNPNSIYYTNFETPFRAFSTKSTCRFNLCTPNSFWSSPKVNCITQILNAQYDPTLFNHTLCQPKIIKPTKPTIININSTHTAISPHRKMYLIKNCNSVKIRFLISKSTVIKTKNCSIFYPDQNLILVSHALPEIVHNINIRNFTPASVHFKELSDSLKSTPMNISADQWTDAVIPPDALTKLKQLKNPLLHSFYSHLTLPNLTIVTIAVSAIIFITLLFIIMKSKRSKPPSIVVTPPLQSTVTRPETAPPSPRIRFF